MKVYEEQCVRAARELFENHKLEVKDPHTLIWANPGTGIGKLEYRKLTPNLLSVAGDYGHAEFLWYSGPQGVSFADIASYNSAYIFEKLVAAPRNIPRFEDWDYQVAYRAIVEHVSANIEELQGTAPCPESALKSWLRDFTEHEICGRNGIGSPWSSEEHWMFFMDEIAGTDWKFNKIDFEEMYDIGTVPHRTFYYMIEGLRRAVKAWQEGEIR